MKKKLISLLLIVMLMCTMLAGCGGDYRMDQLIFSVDGAEFNLGMTLNVALQSNNIKAVEDIDLTEEIRTMGTKEIEVKSTTRASTKDKFTIVVWNNTKETITLGEAIIKSITLKQHKFENQDVVAVMDLRLTDELADFEKAFGTDHTSTQSATNTVFSWSGITIQGSKYTAAISAAVANATDVTEISFALIG